jgi:hypothetical protein
MKREVLGAVLGLALLAFAAVAAGADELTVNSILAAQRSGASAEGIVAMVNNPANTIAMTAGDLVTLRDAGVPETVISAIWARVPAPTPAPVPLQPDDARLVDLVRLIKSGISESITAEQVKQSDQAYNLSVNDLLYLKENGVQESMIAALMATHVVDATAPAVAPSELVFDSLVLVKKGLFDFLRKDHAGRLVLHGDVFTWEDSGHPNDNFTFQVSGLEKVWFTCDARSSGDFCHQINFTIVKGDTYRFQDSRRGSGSNAAVLEVMEALRTYFPTLTFAKPSVDS